MMEQAVYDNELGYWEQRLGDDVPLNSVGYHGLSDAFVSWLYRLRARRFCAAARRLIRPQMRVLDIGSGGGFYVDLWAGLGAKNITATDLTQASIRAIRRRFPNIEALPFDVGSDQVPFEPASFEAVSCMDVVHHIIDDGAYARAFENCARILSPGGHLIFTDNFLHGPEFRAPHSASRSLIHIEQVLRDAGFEIVSRRPMFVLMNYPVDSRSEFFKFYWKVVSFAVQNRHAGRLIGMTLYPIEALLTSILKEGPSTEIVVARKR